jgi:hypothetical protein
MSMLDDERIKAAINAAVAKQIIESISPEARDAVIMKSMLRVLEEYDFRSNIRDVMVEKAKTIAERLIETEQWSERVEAAVRVGFERMLVKLSSATEEALKRAICGTPGRYPTAGLVLSCWDAN